MSRANQLDKINQNQQADKQQKALDMHNRRAKVNKSIVETYQSEDQKYPTRNNANKSMISGA